MRTALQAVSLTASLSPYPALFRYCENVNSCKGPEASFSSLLGLHFAPSLFLTAIGSSLPALFLEHSILPPKQIYRVRAPGAVHQGVLLRYPPTPIFLLSLFDKFFCFFMVLCQFGIFPGTFSNKDSLRYLSYQHSIKQSPEVGNLWVPPLVCFPVKQLWHLFHGGRGEYNNLT